MKNLLQLIQFTWKQKGTFCLPNDSNTELSYENTEINWDNDGNGWNPAIVTTTYLVNALTYETFTQYVFNKYRCTKCEFCRR